MFCTLKSSLFHPLAVWLFSLNTIFMRDQIKSLGEQHPLHTQQLLHGSPVHPPWGCASNRFQRHNFRECRSNRGVASLRFPVSLLVLSLCNNRESEFRATISHGLSLDYEPFETCHRGHTVSAIQCCLFSMSALHLSCSLELLLALVKSQSHSLL